MVNGAGGINGLYNEQTSAKGEVRRGHEVRGWDGEWGESGRAGV